MALDGEATVSRMQPAGACDGAAHGPEKPGALAVNCVVTSTRRVVENSPLAFVSTGPKNVVSESEFFEAAKSISTPACASPAASRRPLSTTDFRPASYLDRSVSAYGMGSVERSSNVLDVSAVRSGRGGLTSALHVYRPCWVGAVSTPSRNSVTSSAVTPAGSVAETHTGQKRIWTPPASWST